MTSGCGAAGRQPDAMGRTHDAMVRRSGRTPTNPMGRRWARHKPRDSRAHNDHATQANVALQHDQPSLLQCTICLLHCGDTNCHKLTCHNMTRIVTALQHRHNALDWCGQTCVPGVRHTIITIC